MVPFGGPYWIMGRTSDSGGGGSRIQGPSLIAKTVASSRCGPIDISTAPSLNMLCFGGFFGSSIVTPFRFTGLDHHFSNMFSPTHF
jgi:hypothetical protein